MAKQKHNPLLKRGFQRDGLTIVDVQTLIDNSKKITGTHAEIKALKDNSELSTGTLYEITDFKTKYLQEQTTLTKEASAEEPLLLLAISSNEFARQVWSALYPKHYIEFNIDDIYTENYEEGSPATIGFRKAYSTSPPIIPEGSYESRININGNTWAATTYSDGTKNYVDAINEIHDIFKNYLINALVSDVSNVLVVPPKSYLVSFSITAYDNSDVYTIEQDDLSILVLNPNIPDLGSLRPGKITKRIDLETSNETPYDFLNIYQVRWETIEGSGIFDNPYNTGYANQEYLTFGYNCKACIVKPCDYDYSGYYYNNIIFENDCNEIFCDYKVYDCTIKSGSTNSKLSRCTLIISMLLNTDLVACSELMLPVLSICNFNNVGQINDLNGWINVDCKNISFSGVDFSSATHVHVGYNKSILINSNDELRVTFLGITGQLDISYVTS